ncbi:MAG: amino acid permease, partial [Burkholderiales bacterium]|nr:amino acid permease [Burkholderiales bacterium]
MELNKRISPHKQELSRNLNLMHLIAFGMNFISPFSIVIIFGLVAKQSGKTVALPVLLAFVVMLFIAHSYIYMVKRNPVAGSLYSYVDALLGRRLGFLSGWILFLDYILGPVAVCIVAVNYLQYYFPELNWHLILALYILLTGSLNLFGVRIVANIGLFLFVISEMVVFYCMYTFGQHIITTHHSIFSLAAFSFNSYTSLFTATTLTVFGYLGYDAISTLAEEAKKPTKNLPKAILISIGFSAVTMFLMGYFAVLAMPNFTSYLNDSFWTDNAFYNILANVGSKTFIAIFATNIVVSMLVFNIVSTTGASRILYGMGRDRVLPQNFFGKINKRFKTPHNNIVLIMLIELLIANFISLKLIAEMINFGAITAFCILNFAVFLHQIKQNKIITSWQKLQATIPLVGAILMIILIILMQPITLIIGFSWVFIGIIYMLLNKHIKNKVADNNLINDIVVEQYTNNNNIQLVNAFHYPDLVKELSFYFDYEHMNMSPVITNALLSNPNTGFVLLLKEGELVGSICAYSYNNTFVFAGMYYVIPEYRGDNYGLLLTGAALNLIGSKLVACNAVYSQIEVYRRIGFQPMFVVKRFLFSVNAIRLNELQNECQQHKQHIRAIIESDLPAVASYDEKHFYANRMQLLSFVFKHTKNNYVYIENDIVQGYIAITPAADHLKITPLIANNIEIAIALTIFAISDFDEIGFSVDMPIINENSLKYINKLDLIEHGLKGVRMHKGQLTINNIN